MTAYEATEWSDFFVAVAGASAALTGLVFVAVSINIERILKLQGVTARALATLLLLLGALVVSLLALAPGLSRVALGLLLLAQGRMRFAHDVTECLRARVRRRLHAQRSEPHDEVGRHGAAAVASGPVGQHGIAE